MFLNSVKSALIENGLIEKNSRLLVALSGGADSTALLTALCCLKDELGFSVSAAHFNHKIREEADADEAFCDELCKKLGVDFYSSSEDVPLEAEKRSLSLETAARIMRYRFLNETRKRIGACCIATAHHLNDDVESVLMHLIRGSGMSGLTGIKYRSVNVIPSFDKNDDEKCLFIRPLLQLDKGEILAFLSERGQSFCEDKTNNDDDAARNYLRLNIIPLIKNNINSSFETNVIRLKNILQEDEAYLDGIAKTALEDAVDGDGYSIKKLCELPAPIKKRCLRLALSKKASLVDIEKKHIDMLIELLKMSSGARMDLPFSTARLSFGRIIIEKSDKNDKKSEEKRFSLFEEGMVLKLKAGVYNTPIGAFKLTLIDRANMENALKMVYNDKNTAFLDADKLKNELIVRTRRRGDRFHPLNSQWNMKLKDFFVSRKTDEKTRGGIPLIESGGKIVFIPGFIISDEAKITRSTERILKTEYLGTNNAEEKSNE